MSRPAPSDGWLDPARFLEVARDCGWSPAELGRYYLDGTREQLARIGAALEAGDAGEVRRLAHGCFGSSATCAVGGMAELFRRLEQAGDDGQLDGAPALLAEAEGGLEAVARRIAELGDGE